MTSKTISVGGEVHGAGELKGPRLRISTLVASYRFTDTRYPARYVQVKIGDYVAFNAMWSEESRAIATGIIAAVLGAAEPDLCKYLTRALMEVEL